LTIGETELAEGKANLKKMETGEEISVSLNDVYEDFAKLAK
jgi:histidyl-tRNA synthetase